VAAGRETQPFGAVPDQVRVEAGLGQTPLHVLADCLVIFDDENLHPVGRYTLKFDPRRRATRRRSAAVLGDDAVTDRETETGAAPCGFVVKNGSKIWADPRRLMPVPVSMNSSRISSVRSG